MESLIIWSKWSVNKVTISSSIRPGVIWRNVRTRSTKYLAQFCCLPLRYFSRTRFWSMPHCIFLYQYWSVKYLSPSPMYAHPFLTNCHQWLACPSILQLFVSVITSSSMFISLYYCRFRRMLHELHFCSRSGNCKGLDDPIGTLLSPAVLTLGHVIKIPWGGKVTWVDNCFLIFVFYFACRSVRPVGLLF